MTRFSGEVVTRDIGRRGCSGLTTWGPQRLAIELVGCSFPRYVAVPLYAVFRRMAHQQAPNLAFPVGLSTSSCCIRR